jgi:hypothetical protein
MTFAAFFDRMLAAKPQKTVIADGARGGPSLADIHTSEAATTPDHEAHTAADRIDAERDGAARP